MLDSVLNLQDLPGQYSGSSSISGTFEFYKGWPLKIVNLVYRKKIVLENEILCFKEIMNMVFTEGNLRVVKRNWNILQFFSKTRLSDNEMSCAECGASINFIN